MLIGRVSLKTVVALAIVLPITPLTSFIKDVLLLVLILFLIWKQRYIEPIFTRRNRTLYTCIQPAVYHRYYNGMH